MTRVPWRHRRCATTTANATSRARQSRAASSTGKSGHLFVVQKHAARRLHYDLRLELDGVLKSWAVTSGPSLSPNDKRLAVHVEDHPLDYAEFEGRIPDGEYGAGSVIVWDRGRWSTEGDPHKQLAKGHLEFELKGSKLKGRWHLVHMRGRDTKGKENWLLIKADDEYASAEGGPDLLEAKPRSVKTGRTVEDVGDQRREDQAEAGAEVEAGRCCRWRRRGGRAAHPCSRGPNRAADQRAARGRRPAWRQAGRAALLRRAAAGLRSPPIRRSARDGCTRSSSTAIGCSPASIAAA